ncbi:hypothetical protein [Arcicella rigui]|uniref:Uncharacterized protein n=1 Tax=Arcicella rigui TaxID=797020 RepID=A0ABU5QAC9_9BACT|nr:hypothetical protein [Arcicella rigui]MEA5139804.1 hypothetical protein [Arcicella rigui]
MSVYAIFLFFMQKIFSLFSFNHNSESKKLQLLYAFGFTFFTVIALGIDSVAFKNHYFDGRNVTNILAFIYFFLIYFVSDKHLKKLMFVMIFLSYLGEVIFSTILGMYLYRTEQIPLYVPFGHSIVYASGFIFAKTNWAKANELLLRKIFIAFFLVLFLCVGFFLNDYFSLIFGVFFFAILKRKKMDNLYSFIALCVIFIELVGTYFQCWTWIPKTFGVIPAANPPMGAIFFYAGGDVLLVKIVSLIEKRSEKK